MFDGPWAIDSLVDECTLPGTGPELTPLLIVGISLIAAGLLAMGRARSLRVDA